MIERHYAAPLLVLSLEANETCDANTIPLLLLIVVTKQAPSDRPARAICPNNVGKRPAIHTPYGSNPHLFCHAKPRCRRR